MKRSSKTNIRDLEAKFSETAFRLSQERSDFLLPQILDFVKKEKWLNLQPEYQRRLVWDDAKRSLFIESLLLNIPIPPLFLYERELGRYEVMDGQQRLSAIVDYYENAFPLRGLEKWKELNGFLFRDLPDTLQRGLDRRRLSATVLLVNSTIQESPQKGDIRKLIFERLNTGGQQLNAQELRNCIYAGPFNELLLRLSHDRLFCTLWGIPPYDDNVDAKGHVSAALRDDRLYRRMIDCEIVLRFFAFRKRSNIRGSVRAMLDRCMEENLNMTETQSDSLAGEFLSRLKLAHSLFGEKAFRYQDDCETWKLSQTLFDGIMIALDQLWSKRERLKSRKLEVNKGIRSLLRRQVAYEVIIGRPNTAKAVAKRINLLYRAMNRSLTR